MYPPAAAYPRRPGWARRSTSRAPAGNRRRVRRPRTLVAPSRAASRSSSSCSCARRWASLPNRSACTIAGAVNSRASSRSARTGAGRSSTASRSRTSARNSRASRPGADRLIARLLGRAALVLELEREALHRAVARCSASRSSSSTSAARPAALAISLLAPGREAREFLRHWCASGSPCSICRHRCRARSAAGPRVHGSGDIAGGTAAIQRLAQLQLLLDRLAARLGATSVRGLRTCAVGARLVLRVRPPPGRRGYAAAGGCIPHGPALSEPRPIAMPGDPRPRRIERLVGRCRCRALFASRVRRRGRSSGYSAIYAPGGGCVRRSVGLKRDGRAPGLRRTACVRRLQFPAGPRTPRAGHACPGTGLSRARAKPISARSPARCGRARPRARCPEAPRAGSSSSSARILHRQRPQAPSCSRLRRTPMRSCAG